MTYRSIVLSAALAIAGSLLALAVVASEGHAPAGSAGGSPVFGVTLPPGYRTWQVISVAHEAGNNNDIRAIVGNDVAVKAFRSGGAPYPDGTIIVRLAWKYEASARNNAIFGREQSFVAGEPTNVQVSVKDSKRYASTGGWGYGQFEDGKPTPGESVVNACVACHRKLPAASDFVFTSYSR
jgi:hypothetical protein